MHYGHPTAEQSKAYTRVLQGHVGGYFFKLSIQMCAHFLYL